MTVDGTRAVVAECNYDNHDSCYIPGLQLKANYTLFLTVQCQDECRYMLNSRWSDLEHLSPGDEFIFKFGKETLQLYHVELSDEKFEEFRVHISTRVTRRPFDNVKIYGKYGKGTSPTPQDYDFKSINLW